MGKQGEATLRHALLGATHRDVDFQGATEGSLILANSAGKWGELVIGADHRVLVSNGTTALWSAIPPLAGIASTDDTTQITIANSNPHVTIANNMSVLGTTAGTPLTVSLPNSSSPAIQISYAGAAAAAPSVTGLAGSPAVSITNSGSGGTVIGMSFVPAGAAFAGVTGSVASVIGCKAGAQAFGFGAGANMTVDECIAFKGELNARDTSGGNGDITDGFGFLMGIDSINTGVMTNYYGIRIHDDLEPTTINYLIELGGGTSNPGTVTTTSGLFRVIGNFSAAANETPVYMSEGSTPTIRQLKTKAGDTLGSGDLVCVLV